ncbi:hypothetical protein NCS52_01544700 [Fusarium sp. LHS14.1]|nr:hypothetical protein NCS52_01588200 [Fusarium sp. LHS14.1]KAI8710311.1 hypothetical protein NCS52_01583200 [Fusarium sp. LHS14.1]KAI8710639.1 hypothetical protein NCS52_01544700 [Fusarium sp. LHS14.1]
MSTPAQKANLARIRDNQRRSRARRREHLQELEQRIRVYELQGVKASSEVQLAARRVAEENRQLWGLLNRHGITDDYISNYLHTGGAAAQEDPTPIPNFPSSNRSDAIQSLQQAIAPRRPDHLQPGASNDVVLPQESHKNSIDSDTTSSSSPWGPGPAYIYDPANYHTFPHPPTQPITSRMHQLDQYIPVDLATQALLVIRTHDSGAAFNPLPDHEFGGKPMEIQP